MLPPCLKRRLRAICSIRRIRLADGTLPDGWRAMATYRTALWFDGLSSRWMGDVAGCDAKGAKAIVPLRVEFDGNVFGLFGESDQDGLDLRVRLDGAPLSCAHQKGEVWPFRQSYGQGRLFIWRRAEVPLASGRHTVELVPVIPEGMNAGQLRVESVCVATLALRDEQESVVAGAAKRDKGTE